MDGVFNLYMYVCIMSTGMSLYIMSIGTSICDGDNLYIFCNNNIEKSMSLNGLLTINP